MELVLRRADVADAEPVAALVEASYRHYLPRIGLRPAPMDADYAQVLARETVWVAERDARLAGVVVLAVELDHVLVENLAVAPGYQRLGLGSRLLMVGEETARTARLGEVRLYTHELMTENLAYYARRGFVETERRQENGFRRVFLSKTLR